MSQSNYFNDENQMMNQEYASLVKSARVKPPPAPKHEPKFQQVIDYPKKQKTK